MSISRGTAAVRLTRKIEKLIHRQGPIPVSQYVQACLYDSDDGFYMRDGCGRAGGSSGDFAAPWEPRRSGTSPAQSRASDLRVGDIP